MGTWPIADYDWETLIIIIIIEADLKVNARWEALAEIYTMHSSVPFWNQQSKTGEERTWPKQLRKGDNERPLSSSSLSNLKIFMKIC